LTLHVFCKSCTVTSPQASNSGSAIAKQHGIALGTMGASGRVKGGREEVAWNSHCCCALSKLTWRATETGISLWNYTVGNQKVPETVLLYCNGRTYSNAYQITFKVGDLRSHKHLLHRSWHCWKHRENVFGIFRSSAVAFRLMSFMVAKCVSLRPIFRVKNRQKSLVTGSGECGGWMMTGMVLSERNCCTTSYVWLSALSWCRNHCPCHFSRRFLWTASLSLCKTYM
jgi:hypothetical protein